VRRKAVISEATYCNWRKKYVGLMPSEAEWLEQREEENAKLKRPAAALSHNKAMMRDVASRKLWGLIGGDSWSMLFAAFGRSAFAGHAPFFGHGDSVLAARQANGQSYHRKLQRQVPGGRSEPAQVPEPR